MRNYWLNKIRENSSFDMDRIGARRLCMYIEKYVRQCWLAKLEESKSNTWLRYHIDSFLRAVKFKKAFIMYDVIVTDSLVSILFKKNAESDLFIHVEVELKENDFETNWSDV